MLWGCLGDIWENWKEYEGMGEVGWIADWRRESVSLVGGLWGIIYSWIDELGKGVKLMVKMEVN